MSPPVLSIFSGVFSLHLSQCWDHKIHVSKHPIQAKTRIPTVKLKIPEKHVFITLVKNTFYIFHNFFTVADLLSPNSFSGIFNFTVGILPSSLSAFSF